MVRKYLTIKILLDELKLSKHKVKCHGDYILMLKMSIRQLTHN